MLGFSLGLSKYVVNTEHVFEIIPKVKIQKIPHTPEYLLGTINFGGKPINVIDLRIVIEGSPCRDFLDTRIILISHPSGTGMMGILAEKVVEVSEFSEKDFVDTGVKVKDLPFLGGVLEEGESSTQEIIIETLFDLMNQPIADKPCKT